MLNNSKWSLVVTFAAVSGLLQEFRQDRCGGIALIFGLVSTVLIGLAGGGIDYARLIHRRSQLQAAVDAGVLAGGNALKLATFSEDAIRGLAEQTIRDALKDISNLSVQVSVDRDRTGVFARVENPVRLGFGAFVGLSTVVVGTEAKVSVVGKTRLCILTLDPAADETIKMQDSAQISAQQCSVTSNSTGANGIKLQDTARLAATGICSAGGVRIETSNPPAPSAKTSCPALADPLAGRTVPTGSGCTYTNKVVTSSMTLLPGTYCNGLKVTNGATATLGQGIYIIDSAPLTVDGGATLTGSYVGIFLKGQQTTLKFDKDSTINLTAPKDGVMSGLLVFEDPTAPVLREHVITSNGARQLLGTIYLPRGRLKIDGDRPVADQSAYTVIVARQLKAEKSPNLFMNAMYAASDVPVPEGVGPIGGRLMMTR